MARLTPPDWMRQCTECMGLVGRLIGSAQDYPIREFLAAVEHLVAAHLALLPDYVDGCGSCEEWRTLAARPEAVPLRTVVPLGQDDLRHRAGHLVTGVLEAGRG